VTSFLTPSPELPAFSPLHEPLAAVGAEFELRDGWMVAARIGPDDPGTVGWADASQLAKFERHGAHGHALGRAHRRDDAWWCPLTRDRLLVLGGGEGLDVTTQYAALTVFGPAARETIARFCALDLRAAQAPPGAFRPGSIARTPGAVHVEGRDRFLLLFGAAVAGYLWDVVADAGAHLGGRPVGVDAVREPAHA
jgi:hypothetical protein